MLECDMASSSRRMPSIEIDVQCAEGRARTVVVLPSTSSTVARVMNGWSVRAAYEPHAYSRVPCHVTGKVPGRRCSRLRRRTALPGLCRCPKPRRLGVYNAKAAGRGARQANWPSFHRLKVKGELGGLRIT